MKFNLDKEKINEMAAQIITAAKTAPKGKGVDSLNIGILEEEDKQVILDEMAKLYKQTSRELFFRDANNLRDSDGCILFSVEDKPLGLNCGACGMNCSQMAKTKKIVTDDYAGPNCMFKVMDLGIALGSASKRAMELCIDNRLMYSIGVAARKTNLIKGEIVIAMPLSISGKNIFFDR